MKHIQNRALSPVKSQAAPGCDRWITNVIRPLLYITSTSSRCVRSALDSSSTPPQTLTSVHWMLFHTPISLCRPIVTVPITVILARTQSQPEGLLVSQSADIYSLLCIRPFDAKTICHSLCFLYVSSRIFPFLPLYDCSPTRISMTYVKLISAWLVSHAADIITTTIRKEQLKRVRRFSRLLLRRLASISWA